MRERSVRREHTYLASAVALVLLSACGVAPDSFEGQQAASDQTTTIGESLTLAQHVTICQSDPRVVAGLVPLDVCVGADIFFRETFNGNGRTCASCHRVEQNFTIDPVFIATLPNNDPLFVAEFNPALANLERPTQMRQRGLILENADGTEPGGPNVRFVLRSTPHNLSMGISILTPTPGVGPAERTGWSADGAPFAGRLADFTNGAINQHFTRTLNRVAGTDFRVATEDEGQRVALFMREVGRRNELDLTTTIFSDANADVGRQRFLAVGCNGCHRNAGANTGATLVNRNFNTGVEAARNSGLASFPRDGGLGATPANADGSFGDQTFNSTVLVEAADTGPFFHTATTVANGVAHNTTTATKLEQAVAFYTTPAFANSPAGGGAPLAMNVSDVNNISRFLRAVNAVFNVQIALRRVNASLAMGAFFGGNGSTAQLEKQKRLAALANVEVQDALSVLQGATPSVLHSAQQTQLQNARTQLNNASINNDFTQRTSQLNQAKALLDGVDNAIAPSIVFDLGPGNLMD